ncbi:MAG: transcription initiation protein [Candidatus Dormibacteraeota bacterium]|uniref:Transcription initiation protein n=1 Tax=Candidatus Amunia macphersoniae TaxID=3127014 RepID=A0A934N8H6_9BACT|nr:transcription initiation protein [Candidatus Dormibacteraeota bacterium]
MALYAALLYYPEDSYWTSPEEEQFSAGYAEFGQAAGAAGVLRGGEALHPATMATTITVDGGKGGKVVTSDGPYAEAKEILGGFYVIEAADLDEATRWAAQPPAAWRGKVELRPVVPMSGGAAQS